METEVQLVRQGLLISIADCQSWNVITMNWFARWKVYVNFDMEVSEPRSDEEVALLHPGRIDNTPLSHSVNHPNELRKGLLEERDFVVLPRETAVVLHKKYGLDGPVMYRQVTNLGTKVSPVHHLNLYPVRIEAHHVDSNCPAPQEPDLTEQATIGTANSRRYQIMHYHPMRLVSEALNHIQAKFNIHGSFVARYWLYDPQGQVQMEANPTKKPRLDRKLVQDVLCWDGPWCLLRDGAFALWQVGDIIGNYDSIKIMIETASFSCDTIVWPRDIIVKKWQAHRQTSHNAMASQYLIGDYADITLIVEGERLPAHKCILCPSSEVFRVMFQTNMKEASTNEVQLDSGGWRAPVVKEALRYLYTGGLSDSSWEAMAPELLAFACTYQLTGLKHYAEGYCADKVSERNVKDIVVVAGQHGCEELRIKALQYIADNSKVLMAKPGFLDDFTDAQCREILLLTAEKL